MYNQQIRNLISNLERRDKPIILDIILEGGAFNGMYEVGVLLFIKELEKQAFIKVDRISGVSIGSLMGFSYFTDNLELSMEYYKELREYWKHNFNLNIYEETLKKTINEMKEEDFNNIKNGKLFINYNNVDTLEHTVQDNYNDRNDLMNAILKSSHLPYITNDKMCQEHFFIDGGSPFIFYDREKNTERKILYVSINTLSKMTKMMNVKEINCEGKVLAGILECYNLFHSNQKNNLCSFIHQWNSYDFIILRFKEIFMKILVYLIFFLYKSRDYLTNCDNVIKYSNNIYLSPFKMGINFISGNVKELYRDFILYYCF